MKSEEPLYQNMRRMCSVVNRTIQSKLPYSSTCGSILQVPDVSNNCVCVMRNMEIIQKEEILVNLRGKVEG